MSNGDISLRSRLLHGGFWAILARICGVGITLAVSVLLARMLAPEEMGAYFLAMSVIGVAASFAQMGLPQAVVRLVAESVSANMPGRTRQVILRAMLLSLVGGIAVGLLFYLLLGKPLSLHVLRSNGVYSVISWISLAVIVLSLQGLVTETYRGFHDMRAASLVGSVLTPAVSVVLLTILWVTQSHVNLQQIFVLTVASAIIALLVSGYFLRTRFIHLHGAGGIAYKELLSISWPLCLIQIAIFSSTQADMWIVGFFLSEKDAAIYGSVQKLMMLMTMTHSLVVAVVQSSVAELYAKGERARLERIVQSMAFLACIPAGVLLVAYSLFGADILQLVFGEYYRDAYFPLLILGIGQFASMLLGPSGMVLMMTGHQQQLMSLIVVTNLVSIIIAGAFAELFGVNGVAFAWGLGAVLNGIGAWWMGYRILGVKTHANYSPALVAWRG